MNDERMQDAVTVTLEALDRLQRKVTGAARRAGRTALLQLAPRSLVLPTPAVGLMELTTDETTTLPGGTVFRSLESLLPEGEARLALADRPATIHPWRMGKARWLHDEEHPGSTGRMMATGCAIDLVRDPDHPAAAGWMTIHLEGGELVGWSLRHAVTYGENAPLTARSWSTENSAPADVGDGPAPASDSLESVGRGLLSVMLPGSLDDAARFTLVIRFPSSIPLADSEANCRVAVNAFPVWNSLPCRYPPLPAVEQTVTDGVHHRVHPLTPLDPGPAWRPWHLGRVAGSQGLPLAETRPAHLHPDVPSDGTYRLVLVPAPGPERASDPFVTAPLVPAIVLDDEAIERLKQAGQALRAELAATQGALANGLPPGTEFQLLPHQFPGLVGRISATLVGTTWGGDDGCEIAGPDEGGVDDVLAMVRDASQVTVDDVASLVRRRFGHALALVDPEDLLSREPGPLAIRIRHLIRDGLPSQRHALEIALRAFLTHHLSRVAPQGFQLLDVTEEEPDHVRPR